MRSRLLVIDDDQRLRELLQQYLNQYDFDVTTAATPAQARALMALTSFDLIILDVMMPGETGLSFLDTLRSDETGASQHIPVLLLTAMGEPRDRITGLEKGADDYLVKPFDPKELLLRVQTILRRANPVHLKKNLVRLGEQSYDLHRQTLYAGDTPVALSTVETNLLHILAESAGKIVTRDELARRGGVELSPRTVDVQVARLRRKIETDAKEARYICTVRHQGYILRPDA